MTNADRLFAYLKFLLAQLRGDFLVYKSYPLSIYFTFIGLIGQIIFLYLIGELIGEEKWNELTGGQLKYFEFAFSGLVFWNFTKGISGILPSNALNQYRSGRLIFVQLNPHGKLTGLIASMLFPTINQIINIAILLTASHYFIGISFSGLFSLNFLYNICIIWLIFWGLGLISSALVILLKRGDVIQPMLNYFATFISGIYFPIAMLPEPLQKIGLALPQTWAVLNLRSALYETGNPALGKINLALIAVIFISAGLFTFYSAINFQRKRGGLGHF